MTALYFSATDGSAPRLNGRRYVVQYPRRDLPATWLLLLLAWGFLPLAAYRLWRRSREVPSAVAATVGADSRSVAVWSVVVAGAVYSLFVTQAWLEPSNAFWLLAVGVASFAPCLDRLARMEASDWRPHGWILWMAGLVMWSMSSSIAGSSYAAVGAGAKFVGASIWGLALYMGFRDRLAEADRLGPQVLVGLFTLGVALSLGRDAGFDLTGALASLGLGGISSEGVVNPWTTKFIGHWLLVLAWCTLAAHGLDRTRGRWTVVFVAVLTVLVVVVNGSKSAAVALVLSSGVATLALRWPRATRRMLVSGLVLGVLLAPFWGGIPWKLGAVVPPGLVEGPLSELEMDVRGGMWEFSRGLIGAHPLVGWGFGASGSLPGRDLSLSEVLSVRSDTERVKLSDHWALAGGHPHNAALLTWLDMGLVGALLVAGLLAAIGRSIGRAEPASGRHAALLGLLTVNAVIFVFNYPAWEPEVLSILWMSVALASAVVRFPGQARRRRLIDAAAVLVIVAVGCSGLVHERVSRWMTVRSLRSANVALSSEDGALDVGERSWRLDYDSTLRGGVQLFEGLPGSTASIRGWALATPASTSSGVLVFVGSELAGIAWPERPSPEIFREVEPRDTQALTCGFWLSVDPGQLDRSAAVTLVVLGEERALARKLPPLTESSAKGARRRWEERALGRTRP